MTKAQIIQRLLEEGQINVEEAMILMSQDPMPINVYNPYTPPFKVGDQDWTGNEYRTDQTWYSTNTGSVE